MDKERIAEYLEDKLSNAWHKGISKRGIDVTEDAEEIMKALETEFGYTRHEPSQDKVEARKAVDNTQDIIANMLWEAFKDYINWWCMGSGGGGDGSFLRSVNKTATEILSLLSPVPKLTAVQNKYPITDKFGDPDYIDGIVREAYAEGCKAQLEHDRNTLKEKNYGS